jgi:hypothetical protein
LFLELGLRLRAFLLLIILWLPVVVLEVHIIQAVAGLAVLEQAQVCL